MDVRELKKAIETNTIPRTMVFIDSNYILMKEYLSAISARLNRRVEHTYTDQDTKAMATRFDRNDILVVAHGLKDFSVWAQGLDFYSVFIQLEDINTTLPKVSFPKLNKNQCLLYLDNKLEEKKLKLSRENLEKWTTYFDNDLDQIMCEFNKLCSLEVKSLDRPFEALFACLPDKDKRLKSLPWYSGGMVDTANVLYNTYLKKLKASGELNTPLQKQRWFSQLIREAVFVEVNILSGTFGDYALEYFELIERMSPNELKILWSPPISMEDVEANPEWKL